MVWSAGVEQVCGSGDVGTHVIGGVSSEASSSRSFGPVLGEMLEGTNGQGWGDSEVRVILGLGAGLTEGHFHSPCPIPHLKIFPN